uniref:Uncharacterized protein n=1 Tax=Cyprinodon variegatus TaxID=28743 RepID=A0A3Q2D0G1_CYPVA
MCKLSKTAVCEPWLQQRQPQSKAPLIDYLANAGCLRTMQSIGDRDLLVIQLFWIGHEVIHFIIFPFYRFCEGLKTLGVLEKIQRHPDSFRPLFCYEPCNLNADQLDDLFRISLSPDESNNRAAEEIVVTFWRDYLQDAEGKIEFDFNIHHVPVPLGNESWDNQRYIGYIRPVLYYFSLLFLGWILG